MHPDHCPLQGVGRGGHSVMDAVASRSEVVYRSEARASGYLCSSRRMTPLKTENVDRIAQVVSDLVASSLVAKRFSGVVDVDEGRFDNDDKFLRILVHFTDLNSLSDDDVDTVASSIEGAVAKIDDRFPSVRFSDD